MKFTINDSEFGEIYHMACAYQLDSSVTVEFPSSTRSQDFFDTFIVSKLRQPQGEPAHAGESANVIRDRYYDGCMKSVCDAIAERARQDGWNYPPEFKRLLTRDSKVLLWHRKKERHQEHRNSSPELIKQLADLCRDHTTKPVLIAKSAVPDSNCYELVCYWDNEFFNEHSVAKQLWCLDALFQSGGTLASVGVMSGAMDGPALFFGHKTIFLASLEDASPRMQKVSAKVPKLMWQKIEYSKPLFKLTDADLSALERNIWC